VTFDQIQELMTVLHCKIFEYKMSILEEFYNENNNNQLDDYVVIGLCDCE
jgi:hypothetical protein